MRSYRFAVDNNGKTHWPFIIFKSLYYHKEYDNAKKVNKFPSCFWNMFSARSDGRNNPQRAIMHAVVGAWKFWQQTRFAGSRPLRGIAVAAIDQIVVLWGTAGGLITAQPLCNWFKRNQLSALHWCSLSTGRRQRVRASENVHPDKVFGEHRRVFGTGKQKSANKHHTGENTSRLGILSFSKFFFYFIINNSVWDNKFIWFLFHTKVILKI